MIIPAECLEYNKNTVERVEVIPLLADPRSSGVLITKCNFDGLPLVVGGEPALPGEFPFMVKWWFYESFVYNLDLSLCNRLFWVILVLATVSNGTAVER